MALVDELRQKDRQEGIREGTQKSQEEARVILIENLLASGMSLEQVAMATKMTAAEVALQTPLDLNPQTAPINVDVTRYGQLKSLSDKQFRDLTGVKISAFAKMLEILRLEDQERKAKGGRQYKLPLEDQLLIALEYYRENRISPELSNSYGMSDYTVRRIVKFVKGTLSKYPALALKVRRSKKVVT